MSKVKIGQGAADEELIGLDDVDEEWIGGKKVDKSQPRRDDYRTIKVSNINSDYFILSSDFEATHPILEEDDELARALRKDTMLDDVKEDIVLNIAKPYPKKIEMCDYHSSPNAVISAKVVTVLCSFKTIYGIQLLPVNIADNDGNMYPNYYLMHIYNNIDCIDHKRSTFDVNDRTQSKSIKKLRLNNVSLNKISLSDRLIFRPEGARHLKIFHKSVVEVIEKSDIVGLRFYNIKEYYDGVQFDSFFK